MASSSNYQRVEQVPDEDDRPRESTESTSTTSLILERINNAEQQHATPRIPYDDPDQDRFYDDRDDDVEASREKAPAIKSSETKVKRIVYIIGAILVGSWFVALIVYLSSEYNAIHEKPKAKVPLGKELTITQVLHGQFRAAHHNIEWIADPEGKRDGLMLTKDSSSVPGAYLVVEDLQGEKQVLMKGRVFTVNGETVHAEEAWPSADLKKVLVAANKESKFRHSYSATYWIFDVASGTATPLIPGQSTSLVQLAVWSPTSDAVAFVRGNNLFIRKISPQIVVQVTKDGGKDLFYGIPDWVYEEEVFAGNKALWWSGDGKHLAFLRTNESEVPEYPIQYFVSRPSHEEPKPGAENYPEVELIKYPKAGAPNPVVDLQFWDVEKAQVYTVKIENDFGDDQRLITEVVWAGKKVLVRETNRESDVLKMVLIDPSTRSGKVVREQDVAALDGGWFEVSQQTQFIPADPSKGRKDDGYIDTVIDEGFNHLAYFSPLDSSSPRMLTTGSWEVVDAPSVVDLDKNLVYFIGTQVSSTGRHVYNVGLDGKTIKPVTNTTEDARYGVSFSKKGGYALLSYAGPGVPWQKVIGTDSGDVKFVKEIENNDELRKKVAEYALPTFHHSTVKIDGFELNVVERRPPGFDPKKKYPVLFYVYGGPGSQTVTKSFNIDFQAFVAGGLGYIVVSVDGRGTGFIGRKARCAVRGDLGKWEARDQIETAKIWKAKEYVDGERMAIWGWSYGGFMTLKTLETDAGRTFKYGMAVAPVTDWRFYDSIYTERYMHTPQNNPKGYASSSISNTTALAQTVRFLFMHGVSDDNVHLQNSLTLLDKLDVASVENYDVHVFPDSDHSIYFHNANRMVYDRLANWLVTAFNGDFLNREGLHPVKDDEDGESGYGRMRLKREVEGYYGALPMP